MHSFRCPILFLASFFWSAVQVQAQTFPAGELCGCPEVSQRDTVWVTDNDGAGVGSATWTCDHLYVLTEQVFVNAADTLTMEPGTVVLGMAGEGRSELDVPVNFGVGSVRDVTYDVYPGALVVSRGGVFGRARHFFVSHSNVVSGRPDGWIGGSRCDRPMGRACVVRCRPNQHPPP